MKKIKKLLYLLQLEEYQTDRYFSWLKKYQIENLEERKNKLRWTSRAILTLLISVLALPFLGANQAIGFANKLLNPLFQFLEEIIVSLAKIKLKFYPHLIKIVITGSYGKTTFKELLVFILEAKYSVLKMPGNINTRLGIAQIILKKLREKHKIMIVEAGAYKRGDIEKICQLIKPSFGIITVIGWMHLERFKSLTNIRKTKLELLSFIKDKEKLFFPNKDHQFINFEKTITKIGQKLNLPEEVIEKRLANFQPPEHRLTIRKANGNLIILDDTYNSNPLGFEKALTLLKAYKNYQKIVATPGMIELGGKQFCLNKKLAKQAGEIANIMLIIGETNKRALISGTKEVQKKGLKIIYLKKNENLDEKLTPYLRPPTIILLENDLPDHYF